MRSRPLLRLSPDNFRQLLGRPDRRTLDMLSRLVAQLPQLSSPARLQQALQILYTGMSGPARPLIYRALQDLGQDKPMEPVLLELGERLQFPDQAQFISEAVAQKTEEVLQALVHGKDPYPVQNTPRIRLRELPHSEFLNVKTSKAEPIPEHVISSFQRTDVELRRRVAETWRAYEKRLEKYKDRKQSLPREYKEDPIKHYRILADNFLDDKVNRGERFSKIIFFGSQFFDVRHQVNIETGTVPRIVSTSEKVLRKVERLRESYGLHIPVKLEKLLVASVVKVNQAQGSPARFDALFQHILPNAPQWLHELALLFFNYLNYSPDDSVFILQAVRLMQGTTNQEADEITLVDRQNKRRTLVDLERGFMNKGALTRELFRSAVIMHGIPYEQLAHAHQRTTYPALKLSALTFYQRPVFFRYVELRKVETYLRHTPSLGEQLFFLRTERDATVKEFVAGTGIGIPTYERAENNERLLPSEGADALSWRHGIPLDQLRSLPLSG